MISVMKFADSCTVRVLKITTSGSEGNCYSMIPCFLLIYANIQGSSFIAGLSTACIMVHTGRCGHFVELLCSV